MASEVVEQLRNVFTQMYATCLKCEKSPTQLYLCGEMPKDPDGPVDDWDPLCSECAAKCERGCGIHKIFPIPQGVKDLMREILND